MFLFKVLPELFTDDFMPSLSWSASLVSLPVVTACEEYPHKTDPPPCQPSQSKLVSDIGQLTCSH